MVKILFQFQSGVRSTFFHHCCCCDDDVSRSLSKWSLKGSACMRRYFCSDRNQTSTSIVIRRRIRGDDDNDGVLRRDELMAAWSGALLHRELSSNIKSNKTSSAATYSPPTLWFALWVILFNNLNLYLPNSDVDRSWKAIDFLKNWNHYHPMIVLSSFSLRTLILSGRFPGIIDFAWQNEGRSILYLSSVFQWRLRPPLPIKILFLAKKERLVLLTRFLSENGEVDKITQQNKCTFDQVLLHIFSSLYIEILDKLTRR